MLHKGRSEADTCGMVTTSDRPPQASARWARILSKPSLLGTSGLFSVIIGGGVGAVWVYGLRDHWSHDWRRYCNDTLLFGNPYRTLVSWIAVASALAAGLSLFRIAAARGTRKTLAVYWLASLVLWSVLAMMVYSWFFFSCSYEL